MNLNYLIAVPALPLLGAIIVAIFGRKLGERSHWPIVIAFALSFFCSVGVLNGVYSEASHKVEGRIGVESTKKLWNWITLQDAYKLDQALPVVKSFEGKETGETTGPQSVPFLVDVVLRADPLTSIMLCMVTFISTLVAIYASGYMHGDRGYWRFFTYVGLFVFSMTMLVSVSNFALLFVFWEAVGACSYLLIGFWYQKPSAAAAGKKAFLVNRVGDFGFAIALFLIWCNYGTLNYHDDSFINAQGQTVHVAGVLGQTRLAEPDSLYVHGGVAVAICALLMLGACGKSAQFPLHVWLPDAMEGPTPVSALIHAATMVTAGVYMVTRCTPLFSAAGGAPLFNVGETAFTAQMLVAAIGGFTALLAGLIAVTQTDLKRVLAYSTVSQLGYMFLALGTGSTLGIVAGMFHLFTHAFFKALLFLGSGSVMHAMGHIIDMRQFSGLRKIMPITHWTFLIGCLALAGIFPLAGFWSKDEILAALHIQAHEHHSAFYGTLYWLAVGCAGLTAFYTFRAFFMTFYGPLKVPSEAGSHAHESPSNMTLPLMILAVCSVIVGVAFGATHKFLDFIHQTPSLSFGEFGHALHPEFHWDIAITGTLVAVIGIALAAYFYLGEKSQADALAGFFKKVYFYQLSLGKFFIDQLYIMLFVAPLMLIAQALYVFDRIFIDGLVDVVGFLPKLGGSMMRMVQNGMLQFYALAMVLGLIVLTIGMLYYKG